METEPTLTEAEAFANSEEHEGEWMAYAWEHGLWYSELKADWEREGR
jgi:hypothetical protein